MEGPLWWFCSFSQGQWSDQTMTFYNSSWISLRFLQDNSYFIIHNSKVYGLHPISMMDQYFDGKSDLFSYNVVKSHIFQLFFDKSDRRRVKTFLKGHFINLLSVPVNKKNADNSALLWNRDLNSNYTRIYTNMFVLCHSLYFFQWDADNKVWKF